MTIVFDDPKVKQFCFFAKFFSLTNKSLTNSFLKFYPQKYPSKAILVPNSDIFIFSRNCNWSNSRILISNTTIQFTNSSQKIRQSGIIWLILVLNLRIFYFCTKLCNKTNPRALVSNMTMAFSNCRLKIPKQSNFCPKFKCFFIFAWNVEKYWFGNGNNVFHILAKKYPKTKFPLNTQKFFSF